MGSRGPRRWTRIAAVACLVGACALPAQPFGPEFRINTFTPGWQFEPATATNGAGEFLVVWNSRDQDGSGWGVFGRAFDAAVEPVGGDFRVNAWTTGWQRFPAVAALAGGDFVVVWEAEQDGSYTGVFGRRFDATGQPLGGEFQVNTYTTDYQGDPSVAADDEGGFLVVWQSGPDQDGSLTGLFARRFDEYGQPLGGEFGINTHTESAQELPQVAALAGGGFVVVWESLGQDGPTSWGVFGQRLGTHGELQGGEFQVNLYTTSGQQNPVVEALAAGGFVVAWDSYRQDGSSEGVFARRFDGAGQPLGGELQMNSETASDQRISALAADGGGGFFATWSSFSFDPSFDEVCAQRIDATGARVGSELQLNDFTTSNQQRSAIAHGPDGELVVVWQSYGQDGSGHGIFARRVSAPVFHDGFGSGDACAWSLSTGGGCR